jgi:ABC-type phosphate transport system substrate-binding protein
MGARIKKSMIPLGIVFMLLFMFLGTRAIAQDVLIVVNGNAGVTQITEMQLHDIFTGTRTRFENGNRAVPVILKGGPVHEVFLHRHVGDTPDEFRVRWRKAVFTGQGSMPKECNSEAELLNYVQATPGAIGYVSRMSGNAGVKLLVITGR